MPAKSPSRGQAKGPAETSVDAPTVGKSNGRRAPSGATKVPSGVSAKEVSRVVGNGVAKATAPTKPSSKLPRSKGKKYSYNMPKSEHETIVALKERLNEQGIKVKKSELIRVGIQLFVGLSDTRVKAALRKILADTVTEDAA